MNETNRKPSWWVLYVLLFVMIGALLLESRDGLPAWAHEVADISIVVLFFASVGLWLHVNGPALWNEELEKGKNDTIEITEYPAQSPWPPEEDVKDENNSITPFQAYRFR